MIGNRGGSYSLHISSSSERVLSTTAAGVQPEAVWIVSWVSCRALAVAGDSDQLWPSITMSDSSHGGLISPPPRSPGGTPLAGWETRKPATPEGVRQFNQLLIDKFRNIKTPPSPCCGRQASPGMFDSPL